MATLTVSRSDEAKECVLEAIKRLGGRVEGVDIHEIKQCLGLDHLSNRVLSSALWKLVVHDGKLCFQTKRDWEGCDPRGYPTIAKRTYKLR